MSQFTVYQNKNKATQAAYPFLLNIQNDLLASMQTCVVVPLTPIKTMAHQPICKLTPVLPVQGQDYCMMTPQLAGIHKRELGAEVEILTAYQNDIIAAIDFLLSGV
ncbi:MAG: CcdB family protein [Methylotenera sp.]